MKFSAALLRRGVASAVLLAALITLPVEAAKPPLTWRDTAGRAYGASDLRGAAATVFVFGSTTCPCADSYNGRVKELATELSPRGARFFQVFSAGSAQEVGRYAESRL